MVDGLITGCEPIDPAPQAFDLSRELPSTALGRTPEENVLEDMGHASGFGIFVCRAGFNPQLKGCQRSRGVSLDDHPQAVGESERVSPVERGGDLGRQRGKENEQGKEQDSRLERTFEHRYGPVAA